MQMLFVDDCPGRSHREAESTVGKCINASDGRDILCQKNSHVMHQNELQASYEPYQVWHGFAHTWKASMKCCCWSSRMRAEAMAASGTRRKPLTKLVLACTNFSWSKRETYERPASTHKLCILLILHQLQSYCQLKTVLLGPKFSAC